MKSQTLNQINDNLRKINTEIGILDIKVNTIDKNEYLKRIKFISGLVKNIENLLAGE